MHKPPILRIDHVAINVTDVARAKRFYSELLQLTEIPRPPTFLFPGAWYRIGNADLHLVGRKDVDPESSRHFALWVEDVHGWGRVIESAGHAVNWDRTKIPGIDRFFTFDPDGNRVEFQGTEKAPHS